MDNIYSFERLENYVRASFNDAKESSPQLSVELYADRLGLGRSTFKMLLTGKRNFTTEHVHKIAKALKFNTHEIDYATALVLKSRAKTNLEKRFYKRRLEEVRSGTTVDTFQLSKNELLSDPYSLPVLVYLTDFSDGSDLLKESAEIAKRLRIEPSRVEKIIDLLISSGVIEQRPKSNKVHYVFSKLTNLIAQKEYLNRWLKESAQKIETGFKKHDHLFDTTTLSIAEEEIPALISDLKSVLARYIEAPITPAQPKTIIQSNIQLFPILSK